MSARALAAVAVSLLAGVASAQQGNPIPVPTGEKARTTSSQEIYERETAFKKKYQEESERRRKLEDELAGIKTKLTEAGKEPGKAPGAAAEPGSTSLYDPTRLDAPVAVPPPGERAVRTRRSDVSVTPVVVEREPGRDQPLVFAVSASASEPLMPETAVPLGSYVKARVLTGVEANTLEAYPVLLQLDYAFVGPNRTRIDLSHCFMIAKAKANLSTERVLGETQQISCVRENNEVVTRAAKGYVAGEDSTFGITGKLISHQGQVLLAAVVASLAKGVGEAVSTAQTSTTVVGGNGAVAQGTNVTGDKLAYVGGKAIMEPASLIANWYLDYAKQLVPSIAVGSGRDVWIVLLDTVKVPELAVVDDGGEER